MKFKAGFSAYVVLPLILFISVISAQGGNWNGFRWASTQKPLVVPLGNNVNSQWLSMVQNASSNWSKSEVLDTIITPGLTTPTQCGLTLGRIEVCNAKYGQTGWYGYTVWWAENGYITGAIVKLNDSYKMSRDYKAMIACHEIGHALGLDHQDTTFGNANLGTCLDYTNNPVGNTQPNVVDYNTLFEVYSNTTLFSTVSLTPTQSAFIVAPKSPRQWGKLVRASRDNSELVFQQDLGSGRAMFTQVTMVPGENLRDEDTNPQLAH